MKHVDNPVLQRRRAAIKQHLNDGPTGRAEYDCQSKKLGPLQNVKPGSLSLKNIDRNQFQYVVLSCWTDKQGNCICDKMTQWESGSFISDQKFEGEFNIWIAVPGTLDQLEELLPCDELFKTAQTHLRDLRQIALKRHEERKKKQSPNVLIVRVKDGKACASTLDAIASWTDQQWEDIIGEPLKGSKK